MRLHTELKSAIPVFAALGDETRLALVSRLAQGDPLSITALTSGADMTRQAVTKHLHVLAEAGLVKGTKSGREQVWALKLARLQKAQQALDRIGRQWENTLGRLKSLVEEDSPSGREKNTEPGC